MKRLLLACIAFTLILALAPATKAEEHGYPACSESEILTLITSLLDYVAVRQPSINTMDDLADNAALHIESRESSFSLLPLCRTAIVTQRQIIMLYGDFAGGSALDRAGVPRSANPYFARDLVDEQRIGRALEDLFAAAGEGAPPEERGKLRFCSRAENDLLNGVAEEFLNIELGPATAQNPLSISVIEYILDWRDETMALLPECAQAIELGFLLSKATTDAAALLAFRYADMPDADNPYAQPVSQARDSLLTWRKDLKIIQPRYKEAAVLALGPASAMPACQLVLIHTTYRVLMRKVLAVVETIHEVETGADLASYEQAHRDLLASSLDPLPFCAELFEFNWLARQLLAEKAAWAASQVLGFEATDNPFAGQLKDTGDAMLSWIDRAEAILESDDRTVPRALEEQQAPACRPGEVLLVISYLAPDFREFVRAGRSTEDLYALFGHSRDLRDRLWRDLPRCREALEIGLAMQQTSGDWIAMLTFDIAGADSEDNMPYLAQVRRGIDRFDELGEKLSQVSSRPAKTYTVTANPYANIRSCAATSCSIIATAQNGDTLSVVDDSSDWYELQLEDGRTGYIAGFLMSETSPES